MSSAAPPGRLAGKVALVTGGCSGIGLATAELFMSEGATVVVADLDAKRGQALEHAHAERLCFARCDVRRESDIEAAVAVAQSRFGRLDVVFNNAGAAGTPDSLEGMSAAGWDSTMELLLRSVVLGTKHAIPALKAAGGGAIVNTASVAGMRVGIGNVAYSVAKAGVLHLTRMAAAELAPYGIRVNAVCPGVIPTPVIGTAFGIGRDVIESLLPQIAEVAKTLQPLARAGETRDVAQACLYLASDAARFVTGAELIVDGGLTQRMPDGLPAAVGRIAAICNPRTSGPKTN
jgi:NAD(P)-dependent dehydrogenase (short-subunit alcohol dehydrogenase family)